MKKRIVLISAAAVFCLTFSISALSGWWIFSNDDDDSAQQVDVTELVWEDFIPDDFVQPENPFASMSQEKIDKLMDGSEESAARLAEIDEAFNYAPVEPSLDGMRVKFPAYVTPLEYDGQTTAKEFLLVPYVGACIHTPPPPANQVVHAQSASPIQVPSIYDAVWATGVIKTETVKSDLAESGYRMVVEEIEPYILP